MSIGYQLDAFNCKGYVSNGKNYQLKVRRQNSGEREEK